MRLALQYTVDGAILDGEVNHGNYNSIGQYRSERARRMVLLANIMGIKMVVSEYDRVVHANDSMDDMYNEEMGQPWSPYRIVTLQPGYLWVFVEPYDLTEFWKRLDAQ